MKVYYNDADHGTEVTGDAPVEMDLEAARALLHGMAAKDCFLGIELVDGRYLQIGVEGAGTYYLEVLDSAKRTKTNCMAGWDATDDAMKAAFDGRDVQQALAKRSLPWVVDTF